MMNAHNNFSTTSHSSTPFDLQRQQHYQAHLNVDGADALDSESPSSSPQSTQSSLLSQYSFQQTPLSATFSAPLDLSQVPDLMPSADQWLLSGQQQQQQQQQFHHHQQTPRGALRLGHHRESSLSSLGSNGPASPYNASTSNPQIAVTDANSEGFHDLNGGDANYSYHPGKALNINDNFYATLQHYTGGASGVPSLDMGYGHGLPDMPASHQRPRGDRNLLPAPELSIGSASRSHPVSVASSIAGDDSPATPSFQEPEEDLRRRKVNGFNNIPKLDRTMTDIYSDELYNPNFTITSASPPPQTHLALSPSSDLFAQRLQAANSQHLTAGHSPVSITSRHQSPFRNGSPLAPTMNDFSQGGSQARLSAQLVRERQKVEQDAKALQQQLARSAQHQHRSQQQQGTPSTISPKDALLEFNETDEVSNFPLFPVQEANAFSQDSVKSMSQQQQEPQAAQLFQATSATPLQNAFNFSMPSNVQLPQQYPFVARAPSHAQQQGTSATSTFSRMSSAESNMSDSSVTSTQRPARVNADGGTYTCTYHGCTQRFETPALLQKHKREGHRQANALTASRVPSAPTNPGSPDSLFNTQAGPHRCDRINPSTGKPCSTIFSRPYDLTRHEDTIHNARKQKVRCNLCTEEKSFSRADALTRHYRVCHPDVEFPGKHRRRGGSAI